MALVAPGPPKFCGGCGHTKPRGEFYAFWQDGRLYAKHRCKKCMDAATNARRRGNPAMARAINQRSYSRIKSDPERYAIKIDQVREWKRQRHGFRRRYRSKWQQPATTGDRCPTFDTAPFVAWLQTLGETPADIAAVCGIARPQVYDYLRGRNSTVTLDVVDRACMRAGADLNELYPLDNAA